MPSIRNERADARAAEHRAKGIRTNFPVSSAEIDATMLAVIRACILDKRPVERQDFLRALVPANEIDARFQRLLAIARQTSQSRRHL